MRAPGEVYTGDIRQRRTGRCPRAQQEITLFTKIAFAAVVVAAVPVLGSQSTSETITKVSNIGAGLVLRSPGSGPICLGR